MKYISFRDEGWPIKQGLNIFHNYRYFTDYGGGSWGWVLRIGNWMWRVRWSKRVKRWFIRIYNLDDELKGLGPDYTETELLHLDRDRPRPSRGPHWRQRV